MEWVEEQGNEIEAISTIYTDKEWKFNSLYPLTYTLSLSIDDCKSLVIEFSFPEGYPITANIHTILRSDWLTNSQIKQIEAKIKDIKRHYERCAQVYAIASGIYEYCKEFVNSETEDDEKQNDKNVKGQKENVEDTTDQNLLQHEVKEIEINHGELMHDRKSIFQAHLAKVDSKDDIQQVLDTLLSNKKIATATHNVYAYRIEQPKCYVEDCHDDGEAGAGSNMLRLLNILKVCNVLIVVTRWYGGINLGPDRFRDYNRCCRQLLEDHNLISESQKSKKHKKKK
ncbi:hypothetical protein GJ496_008267 [Pomphorhynchus laevis]|nr:hypothetical protein GJ496_008267 [Pomphorhynchus laevis]